MRAQLSESRLANLGARAIHDAFDAYHARFRSITRRARTRFEEQAWLGLRADGSERLDLYREALDPTVQQIRELLDERSHDRLTWAGMKAVYSGLIADRDDWELAETFFNSVTRRIFTTVGVDPAIEFVDTDFDTPPTRPRQQVQRVYERTTSLEALFEQILADVRHEAGYADVRGDAARMARAT